MKNTGENITIQATGRCCFLDCFLDKEASNGQPALQCRYFIGFGDRVTYGTDAARTFGVSSAKLSVTDLLRRLTIVAPLR